MMEGTTLLCKRRLGKIFFVFIFCMVLVIINMVMMNNTPLNRITSALCVDKLHTYYLNRPTATEEQANLMTLTGLVTANKSSTEDIAIAINKLFQSEVHKTKFLEWISFYLATRNRLQENTTKPKAEPHTKVSPGHSSATHNPENTTRRDGENRCPDQSPDLIGAIASRQEQPTMEALNSQYHESKPGDKYPATEMGGHYKPKECKSLQKLAIIIPYRNRYSHLLILLNNLIPLLRRQQSDFRIFVIEQNMPTTFNRGMLQNVGYLEALKLDQFDCFVFHDVDMLPLNDRCLYRCRDNPMHLTASVSKWGYGLPYNGYFGGVTAFSREQYKNINGNSNLYFGWGGEDDDLKTRINAKGYKMFRYPTEIGRYDMIKHTRDAGNKANPDRLRMLKTAKARQHLEGLSTTKYNVTNVEYKPLLTWVYASVSMNDVLQTAPAMTKSAIHTLLQEAKRVPSPKR